MTGSAAIYASATFVSTIAGGLFALKFSNWMDRIMAFSGGVLLGAGLLDLLPDAVKLAPPRISGPELTRPLLAVVAGFLLFYLVERMAILRSYHSHHHHPPAGGDGHVHPARRQVGILGAAGLCIHSLLDGFSIAVSFRASPSLGILVAAAVIGHDFSDGVSTVTLLLSNQGSRASSLAWLGLDAIAPLLGVGLAAVIPLPHRYLSDLLGIFAGMFLYLGATHMLPEAHALSDSWITVAWTVVGVGMVVFATHWMG